MRRSARRASPPVPGLTSRWGAFSDDPPWVARPGRRSPGWRASTACAPRLEREVPGAHRARAPCRRACGSLRRRPRGSAAALAVGASASDETATPSRGQPRRLSAPAAHRRRAPRPDLHQARPDHLVRRGPVPRGAGRRVQAAAATRCRPRRSTTCARVVEADLGRPLEDVFACVRPHAARRGVDRPGARGHAAHRRARSS